MSWGLSPPVRGNLEAGCAGSARPSHRRVYPRLCGGTHHENVGLAGEQGLSPPVRGNPTTGPGCDSPLSGSIPACAGEPSEMSTKIQRTGRVYPRLCGGTCPCAKGVRGLGERVYPRLCGGTHFRAGYGATRDGVYPRLCGGTGTGLFASVLQGSIPACAGEPPGPEANISRAGSIPACAGEPTIPERYPGLSPPVRGNLQVRLFVLRWVYPRLCGGTRHPVSLPRPLHRVAPGSIPACAGEPVIPAIRCPEFGKAGLSPPVRGNPFVSKY